MAEYAVLEGGKELERKLVKLGTTTGKKIVRSALRKGGNVILKTTKQNARAMVGGNMGALIAKNLQQRAAKKQRSGSYRLLIQLKPVPEFTHIAKRHSNYPDRTTFIPAAIEYGHDNAAAIPFMRAAFHSERDNAQRTVVDTMWAAIKGEFNR